MGSAISVSARHDDDDGGQPDGRLGDVLSGCLAHLEVDRVDLVREQREDAGEAE